MSRTDLESRLRALHGNHEGFMSPREWGLMKAAAAIGEQIGYARGVAAGRAEAFEEAARIADGLLWPHEIVVAIRALAAQRTDGEVGWCGCGCNTPSVDQEGNPYPRRCLRVAGDKS